MHDKNKNVLHNLGNEYLFWQYHQELYLEPNQKSMVELFYGGALLTFTCQPFLQKSPTINVRLCCL